MRVYLDSVVIIYYLDHTGYLQTTTARRLAALRLADDQVVVSDLVRMECRVLPVRHGDRIRLTRFDGFFAHAGVEKIEITTAVFDRATQIRATHGYRTIDSINLAAAVEGGCDVFLTNDQRLGGFSGIRVEILS